MVLALHCDAEGCDTWQRPGQLADSAWLVVTHGPATFHFCSKEHLMVWAADTSLPGIAGYPT